MLPTQEAEQLDVTGIFVDTAFRATPWAQEAAERGSTDSSAKILFVSESNVCRSVLAVAVMQQLLQERGLAGRVTCSSKGTRCRTSPCSASSACELCCSERQIWCMQGLQ
jgi:hypothetical protein